MQLTGLLVVILFGVAITGNDISEVVVEPIIVGYLEYVEPPLVSIVGHLNSLVLGVGDGGFNSATAVEGDRRPVPPPRIMARIRVARLGDSIRCALGWFTQQSEGVPFPFNADESRSMFRMSMIYRTIDRSPTEQLALSRAADRVERELSATGALKMIEACTDGVAVPLDRFTASGDARGTTNALATIDVSKVYFGPVMSIATTSKLLASLSSVASYSRINASSPTSLMPALAAVSSPAHNGGFVFPAGTTVEFEAPSSMCFGPRGFSGIGVPPYTPLRFKVEFQV